MPFLKEFEIGSPLQISTLEDFISNTCKGAQIKDCYVLLRVVLVLTRLNFCRQPAGTGRLNASNLSWPAGAKTPEFQANLLPPQMATEVAPALALTIPIWEQERN